MARVKPQNNQTVIKSLDEADAALARIASRKREIDLVDLSIQEEIDALKLKASADTEAARQEIAEIGSALARFAEGNKSELFAKRKSVALAFGTLGFQQSSALKTVKKTTWEQVLGYLDGNGMDDCIRVKKEVDKDALRRLSAEQLALVGCRLESKDEFFYELADADSSADLTA